MRNKEIYDYAHKVKNINLQERLPVQISFFLKKNIQMLMLAAEEVENSYFDIVKQFGIFDSDERVYSIPSEHVETAKHEINTLFDLEQDLNIHMFKLSEFENIELTYEQFEAISFMIEE